MEALTEYATYKQGREWRTTPARLSVVTTEPVSAAVELEPQEVGARRLLAEYKRPEEMVRLGGAEVAADAAIRDVQRELRDIDAEIKLRPRPVLGPRFVRTARRARAAR